MYKKIIQMCNDFKGIRRDFDFNNKPEDITGCMVTIPVKEYNRLIINNERARSLLEDDRLKLAKIHDKALHKFIADAEDEIYNSEVEKIKNIDELDELEPEKLLSKYCYSGMDSIGNLKKISEDKLFNILEPEEMVEIIKMVIYQRFMKFEYDSEEQKDGTNEE